MENEYESAQEFIETPAKSTSSNRKNKQRPISPGRMDSSPTSSSSVSVHLEPGIQQLLLGGQTPSVGDVLSSATSSAANSVALEAESPRHHGDDQEFAEPLSYYSQLSPVEHFAPLVDHSACNKTKAQKKQEKKERKKELKKERQEFQQNRLLEKQEREMEEKLAQTASFSPFWDIPSSLANAAMEVADPYISPYSSDSYLFEESEVYDYYDEEEDDDDDDFSFENLDSIKIKKSSRKESSKQNAVSPKRKPKKKSKPKRRGRRADYEETEEGEESATDAEDASLSATPKKDVAARVDAIFGNKDIILKDFDDYIERTAEDLKVIESNQKPNQRRRPRSASASGNKADRRGRSRSAGSNGKNLRSKSVGAALMREKSRSKSHDDTALIAQSFDDAIEIILADTSRSLINKKSTVESRSAHNKSDPKVSIPRRSQSNVRRKDKAKSQNDETIEILLGKKGDRESTKILISGEKDKTERTGPVKDGRKVSASKRFSNSPTRGAGGSQRKSKRDSKEKKKKEDYVEKPPFGHRRMRSNSFSEGDQLLLLLATQESRPQSLVEHLELPSTSLGERRRSIETSGSRDRRQKSLGSLPSVERIERKKGASVSPKPKFSRRAASERHLCSGSNSSSEEKFSTKLKAVTPTSKPKMSRRASDRFFKHKESRTGRSTSPMPKASSRSVSGRSTSPMPKASARSVSGRSTSPMPKSSSQAISQKGFAETSKGKAEGKPSRKESRRGIPSRSQSVILGKSLGIDLESYLLQDEGVEVTSMRGQKADRRHREDTRKRSPSKYLQQSGSEEIPARRERSRSKSNSAHQQQQLALEEGGRGAKEIAEDTKNKRSPMKDRRRKEMGEETGRRNRRTKSLDIGNTFLLSDDDDDSQTNNNNDTERSKSKSRSAHLQQVEQQENESHVSKSTRKSDEGATTKQRSRHRSPAPGEVSVPKRGGEERRRSSKDEGDTNRRNSNKRVDSEERKKRDRSRSQSHSNHRNRVTEEPLTPTRMGDSEEGKKRSRRKSTDESITLDILQSASELLLKEGLDESSNSKWKKNKGSRTNSRSNSRELDELDLEPPAAAPRTNKSSKSTSKNTRRRSLNLDIF
eukprot:scaffold3031_cov102-Cylindrotheca_fusiformis.AAC.2